MVLDLKREGFAGVLVLGVCAIGKRIFCRLRYEKRTELDSTRCLSVTVDTKIFSCTVSLKRSELGLKMKGFPSWIFNREFYSNVDHLGASLVSLYLEMV